MKLSVTAFALTASLVWGLGVLFLTWWIVAWDRPSSAPTWLGRIYRGYALTVARLRAGRGRPTSRLRDSID